MKKKIKITISYDYHYSKDDKLYFSKKGKEKRDTLITEFNLDGSLLHPDPEINWTKTIKIDSVVLISNMLNTRHEREYWSNTTFIDIYIQNSRDSIVQVKLIQNDTIQIHKSYFNKRVLVKTHNMNLRHGYGKYNELIYYDKNTNSTEIATVISTYFKDGLTDTIRIHNHKKRKIYKTLIYNPDMNEWYVKERIKYRKNKRVLLETFYHDYHKMYFKYKTTTKYNKYNLPVSEVIYDKYERVVDSKTKYQYEYY